MSMIDNAQEDDQANLGADLRLDRLHLEGQLISTLIIQGQDRAYSNVAFSY